MSTATDYGDGTGADGSPTATPTGGFGPEPDFSGGSGPGMSSIPRKQTRSRWRVSARFAWDTLRLSVRRGVDGVEAAMQAAGGKSPGQLRRELYGTFGAYNPWRSTAKMKRPITADDARAVFIHHINKLSRRAYLPGLGDPGLTRLWTSATGLPATEFEKFYFQIPQRHRRRMERIAQNRMIRTQQKIHERRRKGSLMGRLADTWLDERTVKAMSDTDQRIHRYREVSRPRIEASDVARLLRQSASALSVLFGKTPTREQFRQDTGRTKPGRRWRPTDRERWEYRRWQADQANFRSAPGDSRHGFVRNLLDQAMEAAAKAGVDSDSFLAGVANEMGYQVHGREMDDSIDYAAGRNWFYRETQRRPGMQAHLGEAVRERLRDSGREYTIPEYLRDPGEFVDKKERRRVARERRAEARGQARDERRAARVIDETVADARRYVRTGSPVPRTIRERLDDATNLTGALANVFGRRWQAGEVDPNSSGLKEVLTHLREDLSATRAAQVEDRRKRFDAEHDGGPLDPSRPATEEILRRSRRSRLEETADRARDFAARVPQQVAGDLRESFREFVATGRAEGRIRMQQRRDALRTLVGLSPVIRPVPMTEPTQSSADGAGTNGRTANGSGRPSAGTRASNSAGTAPGNGRAAAGGPDPAAGPQVVVSRAATPEEIEADRLAAQARAAAKAEAGRRRAATDAANAAAREAAYEQVAARQATQEPVTIDSDQTTRVTSKQQRDASAGIAGQRPVQQQRGDELPVGDDTVARTGTPRTAPRRPVVDPGSSQSGSRPGRGEFQRPGRRRSAAIIDLEQRREAREDAERAAARLPATDDDATRATQRASSAPERNGGADSQTDRQARDTSSDADRTDTQRASGRQPAAPERDAGTRLQSAEPQRAPSSPASGSTGEPTRRARRRADVPNTAHVADAPSSGRSSGRSGNPLDALRGRLQQPETAREKADRETEQHYRAKAAELAARIPRSQGGTGPEPVDEAREAFERRTDGLVRDLAMQIPRSQGGIGPEPGERDSGEDGRTGSVPAVPLDPTVDRIDPAVKPGERDGRGGRDGADR